jgi:hypothetical protein
MISHEDAERRIATWLLATPESSATEVLADTLRVTRRTSQVSALRRHLRSARIAWFGAAATVAIIVVASVVTLRLPQLGSAPPMAPEIAVRPQWVTDNGVALTVHHGTGDEGGYYWRAAAYDQISQDGYGIGIGREKVLGPQTAVLQGTADDVDPAGLHPVTLTIQPGQFTSPLVLAPAGPFTVDQSTRLTTIGENGYFAKLERDGGGPYSVTALVSGGIGGIVVGGVPILRTADPTYPAELLSTYTQVRQGIMGANLSALRDEVVRTAASPGPYDLAHRIVEILQSSRFTYDTDVRDVDCGSMSAAECFATSRRGYCVHYALAMTVLLRDLGIPARIVGGFLPGQVDAQGNEEVPNSNAHSWVEVYFTGAGWVAFDPTPGGRP